MAEIEIRGSESYGDDGEYEFEGNVCIKVEVEDEPIKNEDINPEPAENTGTGHD